MFSLCFLLSFPYCSVFMSLLFSLFLPFLFPIMSLLFPFYYGIIFPSISLLVSPFCPLLFPIISWLHSLFFSLFSLSIPWTSNNDLRSLKSLKWDFDPFKWSRPSQHQGPWSQKQNSNSSWRNQALRCQSWPSFATHEDAKGIRAMLMDFLHDENAGEYVWSWPMSHAVGQLSQEVQLVFTLLEGDSYTPSERQMPTKQPQGPIPLGVERCGGILTVQLSGWPLSLEFLTCTPPVFVTRVHHLTPKTSPSNKNLSPHLHCYG